VISASPWLRSEATKAVGRIRAVVQ
jgi:hypothetical protein